MRIRLAALEAYAVVAGDGDELIQAWETLRAHHGADAFTGKVYGRQKMLGVEEDPKLGKGYWLFALKEKTR